MAIWGNLYGLFYWRTMKTVQDILYRIADTSSKNAKIAILKEELPKNELLQKVAKYALDQGKTYNVTALSTHRGAGIEPYNETDDIFQQLDCLAAKRGASQEEIDDLSFVCRSDAARDIVHRIINKDLRIGATASSFNKAMPGLIYEVPYNRYSSFAKLSPEKVDGEPGFIQLKNDGRFAYMQDPAMSPTPFCSRQGIEYGLHGWLTSDFHWAKQLQKDLGEPIRLEGEMLVLSETLNAKGHHFYLERKTGNGLIEKFILGDKDVGDIGPRIHFVVWGYVTESEFKAGKSSVPYGTVWANMIDAYADVDPSNKIKLTKSKPVRSYAEAMDFYRKVRALGHEGAMYKLEKLKWKDNSSGNPDGFKMKAEAEAEFEIIDAYYGDPGKKYEHLLGGLVVATSDRKIITKIGGGFTDKERELGVEWWLGQRGKIITGKFTEITSDRGARETYCLGHSRLPNMGGEMVETRFSEKEEADTYEYCVEQLKVA